MATSSSRRTEPAPVGPAADLTAAGPALTAYADLLAGPGIDWGLVGPAERDRLWPRHLLNCAAVAALVPARSALLDVGTGAGLPGLVLAIVRPDLSVRLVEPLARRVRFLELCLTELALPNVAVLRSRAEALHGKVSAEVVTARAVAPLVRLAPLLLPLTAPGGVVLAMKGTSVRTELAAAAAVLADLGATATVRRVAVAEGEPATVAVLRAPG